MEKIQNYALIGNGKSAALVSQKGSIDWLCWPRFESPSLFGALLDERIGGFWKIAPSKPFYSNRNYIENTNVLKTHFSTDSGVICLTDFMTALTEEEKKNSLQPEEELIREVFCEEGEVEILIHFQPRPDYGRLKPKLRSLGKLGIRCQLKSHLVTLHTSVPLSCKKHEVNERIFLKKGEKMAFSLTFSSEGPAVIPSLNLTSLKLKQTIEWWKNWTDKCDYVGPFRNEVVRSALVLKLLSFSPSGTFIASPTTSLPGRLKGELNWDYRFCWLRDAAFTVQALFSLGYKEDAEAFVSWLLHSTRLTLPKLKVLYDVYGRNPKKERPLTHLKGYEDSRPVRISNDAKDQFQIDCYGEVIDAVAVFVKEGGTLDREMKKMLRLFGEYVCKHWKREDHGIWEYRKKKQHYTHSKLMCWVALDRLIEMNKKRWLKKSVFMKFMENRAQIREEIEKKGWSDELQSYTAILNENTVDASLLLMSLYGFESADSYRMQCTFEKIKEKLWVDSSCLIYRNEKSFEDSEGAFVTCSFWAAEFLARSRKQKQAHETFAKLLSLANDVGLFSEEIEPKTLDALGNFPQGFTHIALIKAAVSMRVQNELE